MPIPHVDSFKFSEELENYVIEFSKKKSEECFILIEKCLEIRINKANKNGQNSINLDYDRIIDAFVQTDIKYKPTFSERINIFQHIGDRKSHKDYKRLVFNIRKNLSKTLIPRICEKLKSLGYRLGGNGDYLSVCWER